MLAQVHEMVEQVKEYKPAAQEAVENMKMAAKAAAAPSRAQQSPQQRGARAGEHACNLTL